MIADAFRQLWDELAPIGRDEATGGYLRYAFTEPEARLRAYAVVRRGRSAWPPLALVLDRLRAGTRR